VPAVPTVPPIADTGSVCARSPTERALAGRCVALMVIAKAPAGALATWVDHWSALSTLHHAGALLHAPRSESEPDAVRHDAAVAPALVEPCPTSPIPTVSRWPTSESLPGGTPQRCS
jgi:hypothetical protein